ncbi:hypothetical protein NPIL_108241 [Nephila pilipes]|uniref:Uncharacterized protein n=1 Tax=Nephila pilipes TaxID=299642 RepID=A0A8X6T910_NEPPI|nr:hypothetical protein NPIL_108241 [Nephila pilipes]
MIKLSSVGNCYYSPSTKKRLLEVHHRLRFTTTTVLHGSKFNIPRLWSSCHRSHKMPLRIIRERKKYSKEDFSLSRKFFSPNTHPPLLIHEDLTAKWWESPRRSERKADMKLNFDPNVLEDNSLSNEIDEFIEDHCHIIRGKKILFLMWMVSLD